MRNITCFQYLPLYSSSIIDDNIKLEWIILGRFNSFMSIVELLRDIPSDRSIEIIVDNMDIYDKSCSKSDIVNIIKQSKSIVNIYLHNSFNSYDDNKSYTKSELKLSKTYNKLNKVSVCGKSISNEYLIYNINTRHMAVIDKHCSELIQSNYISQYDIIEIDDKCDCIIL